ncbi:MAG: IS3 family transposase [Kiritimatiellia bacterium]
MSRQNHYKQKQVRQKAKVDRELVRHLVLDQRKRQPRLGGLKLFHLLRQTLREHGVKLGRDAFFAVLAEEDLLLAPLPKAPRTTMSGHNLPLFKNLFKDVALTAPHQAVVSDITYVRTTDAFVYISLLTDAYSRKIVGYHVALSLESGESAHALNMMIRGLPPGASPLHHSDRGSQYCCHDYVALLRQHGLGISMTEVQHCAENAMAERMNGILKQEYGLGKTFRNIEKVLMPRTSGLPVQPSTPAHAPLDMRFPADVHAAKCAA